MVVFYRQLPLGRKDISFGVRYQNILVRWHLLNYEEMLAETQIYIRYVVLTIVIFTSILVIELFYLSQKNLFLDVSLSTYLSLSLTGLRHILDKV